jgi:hypothetical protein
MKFIIGISVIGLLSITARTSVAQSSNSVRLPPVALSCLQTGLRNPNLTGKMDTKRYLRFADTQFGNKTYYLVGVFSPGAQYSNPMIISVDTGNRCQIPFFNEHGNLVSFSPSVPKPVAQALALQRIRKSVEEQGGLSNYQTFLLNLARQDGNRIELTPEDLWAMDQLGVRLPPHIKIISPKQ